MNPQDARYAKTHEWARPQQGSDIVTVGITEFAADELGDIVYIELPAVGAKVSAGAAFGVIESAKAAVDLNSPLSGQVVEVNAALAQNFDDLSQDPYGKGWMMKVKASNPAELSALLSAAQYEEVLKQEPHH
jgi:glycine cleavage system H protein